MEDNTNKQLAETELKNQFGFEDYVSIVSAPEETYSNLVEIPSETTEQTASSPVINNINVSVEGGTPAPKNSTFSLQNIINNVFQNVNENISEQEVKKNSDQNSTESTGTLGLSRAQNFASSSDLDDSEKAQEFVEFVENIEELILPDANANINDDDDIASIQMSRYSVSPLKEKEPLLSQTNYTKNITENIVNMANDNPNIRMNSSYARNVYNTTNANFSQDISNPLYQQLSNMSNMLVTNNFYNEMENNNLSFDQINESNNQNDINPQNIGVMSDMNLDGKLLDPGKNPHRSPTFNSLITVINEMNSPPIWRTVLG